jgi:anti-sigma28 factor (negative regulator of flagellin synthesis)
VKPPVLVGGFALVLLFGLSAGDVCAENLVATQTTQAAQGQQATESPNGPASQLAQSTQKQPTTDSHAAPSGGQTKPEVTVADTLAAIQASAQTLQNLILFITFAALAVTAAIGFATVGVFRHFRQVVEYEVRQQVSESISSHFDQYQVDINQKNNVFLSACENFSVRQKELKLEELKGRIPSGQYAVEDFFGDIADIVHQPMRLRDDLFSLAYRRDIEGLQLQRVWALWAEVKAEKIDVRAALEVVEALMPVVGMKPGAAKILDALQKFAQQLRDKRDGKLDLPEAPGF